MVGRRMLPPACLALPLAAVNCGMPEQILAFAVPAGCSLTGPQDDKSVIFANGPTCSTICVTKLLVIEDETKLAEYLQKAPAARKALWSMPHTTALTAYGIPGHRAAHDLIILDGMLPGIDGLAVLAALRQSARHQCSCSRPAPRWKTASKDCRPAPMTTWSSLLHFQNWWPAFMHCCAAASQAQATPQTTVLRMADPGAGSAASPRPRVRQRLDPDGH